MWKDVTDLMKKSQLINDLEFCKRMLEKIIESAKENYNDNDPWGSRKSVIANDIKHLRRELNEIRKKVDE